MISELHKRGLESAREAVKNAASERDVRDASMIFRQALAEVIGDDEDLQAIFTLCDSSAEPLDERACDALIEQLRSNSP